MGNSTVSAQSFLEITFMSPDYALSWSEDGMLGLGLTNISSNVEGPTLFENLAKHYKMDRIFSVYINR